MGLRYKVEWSKQADKQISKFDRQIRKMIFAWVLKNLEETENPRQHGKSLTANLAGSWRYRIGDYRLLAEIQDEKIIILLLRVEHRSRIYER